MYMWVGEWIYGGIKADTVIQLETDLFVNTAIIKLFFLFVHD